MSTDLKLYALLSLPEGFTETLVVGKTYTIEKPGYAIMPFNNPMEVCTSDHQYLGKAVVTEIKITAAGTNITFKVLKVFTPVQVAVYTNNFIREW